MLVHSSNYWSSEITVHVKRCDDDIAPYDRTNSPRESEFLLSLPF
jgi:hypothetical protein